MIDGAGDYLDEIIEESMNDPAFAATWPAIEAANELAVMRVQQGLTQQQIADRMGVKRERIAEIEKDPGRVSYRRLALYASAIGATFKVVPKSPSRKGIVNSPVLYGRAAKTDRATTVHEKTSRGAPSRKKK